jgi:hypothetical protein
MFPCPSPSLSLLPTLSLVPSMSSPIHIPPLLSPTYHHPSLSLDLCPLTAGASILHSAVHEGLQENTAQYTVLSPVQEGESAVCSARLGKHRAPSHKGASYLLFPCLRLPSLLLFPVHFSKSIRFFSFILRTHFRYLPLLPSLSTPPPLTSSSSPLCSWLTPSFSYLPSLSLPLFPSLSDPASQRMLRKVAKEKVQRKSLDGSITQSMMAWQQRRSVQDNNEAMRAFTKSKGDTDSLSHSLTDRHTDRLTR